MNGPEKYADCIANENACYLNIDVSRCIQRLRNNFSVRHSMWAQRKVGKFGVTRRACAARERAASSSVVARSTNAQRDA
ncbi:hypothetical protein [Paraburkholderia nodosa]|uniref:hypothetical protein n=1 Tax=Paraburkholderia nodosa TaxID=392320 RepID=UPI00114CBD2A|nr:hypothetical protein [Paraburkholderia nodosa]